MSSRIAAAAVVLVVGSALFFLLRSEDPEPAAPASEPRATAGTAAPPPALAAGAPAERPSDREGSTATPAPTAPSGRLVVTVTALPRGEPVPDAHVALLSESRESLATARTDAAGVATFAEVTASEVTVEARAPGRAVGWVGVSHANAPGERRVTVSLEPGVALEGVVLRDETGDPVPDAAVVARIGGAVEGLSVASSAPPMARTRTDAHGRFRVDGVPLGEVVSIDATAPGHVPGTRSLLLGAGSEEHPRVEIRLARAGRIVGRVLRSDRGPAAGAEVVAVAVDPEDDDLAALERRAGPWGVGLDTAAIAKTGDDGGYVLDGLAAPGRYRLFARLEGVARSAFSDPVGLARASEVRAADLALRMPSTLVVHVTDAEHRPLADARVWIEMHGMDLVPEKGSRPARFERMTPGAHELRASSAGFVRASRRVVLHEGATLEERLVLERGVAIEGVVVDDAGAPVAGAGVTAYDASGGDGGGGAATDAEGRFRVEGLHPGSYRLATTASGHAESVATSRAPGAGVRLVVRRAGRLRLRLVTPPGAPPVARVEVAVEDLPNGGGVGYGRAFGDGVLEIGDLTAETVRIGLVVPGYAPLVRDEPVLAGATRDLGDVRLGEGATLSGRVVDEQGRPRAGARVRVVLSGALDDIPGTTDREGRFSIPRVPEGELFVRIGAGGCVPGAERVRAEESPFLFTLVPAQRVTGRVRWLSGARPDNPLVVFHREGDAPLGVPRERWESVDDAGRFEILVAAGSHAVTLEEPGDRVLHRVPAPVVVPLDGSLTIDVP